MQEMRIVMMKNAVHPGAVLREDVLADLGLGVSEAIMPVDSTRRWTLMSGLLWECDRARAVDLDEIGQALSDQTDDDA